jgi:formylglycine-generating enzyme required for sulfatase activity
VKQAKRTEQKVAVVTPPPAASPPAPKPVEPAVGVFPAAPKPGETFRDCDTCPEMVVVPAGEFLMGSPENEKGRSEDEGPQRTVKIAKPFAVGKLEVTRDQFEAFVTASGFKVADECSVWTGSMWKKQSGSFRKLGFDQTGNHPAVCVSWDDAKAYAEWLSKKAGKPYRLLSEAEWEYAARAVTEAKPQPRYYFGNDAKELCGYANGADRSTSIFWKNTECDDGVGEGTAESGHYKPNPFGLYDMHGNVWEWVEDCYKDSYAGAPSDGTASTSGDCSLRVRRGGAWIYFPGYLRAANRGWSRPDDRLDDLGLRVGRTLNP